MLMDPVGIADIADRSGVKPDTVKKWIDRYAHFPQHRGKVAGGRLWEWSEVHRWLVSTGRAPHVLRYREDGGPETLKVQRLDGDDNWRTIATIHMSSDPDNDTARTARPTQVAIDEMDGDRAAAQEWADRLLQGWDDKRAAWVRDHPDEPMPAYLVGTRKAIYPEDIPVEEPESAVDPDVDALHAERQRITARLAEIDARLRST